MLILLLVLLLKLQLLLLWAGDDALAVGSVAELRGSRTLSEWAGLADDGVPTF